MLQLLSFGLALGLVSYLSAQTPDALGAQGLWEGARRGYLERYESLKKTLGPENPETALALANACDASVPLAGRLDSIPVCTRALALREKVLGVGSPEVAKSMSDLALLYAAEGDMGRAGKLIERAVRIRGVMPGSPELAGLMNNLGYLYFKKGKYALSREMFARAIAMAGAGVTADRSDLVTMLGNIGIADLAAHDAVAAEAHFRQEVSIAEASFGAGHPKYFQALDDLSRAETALGKSAVKVSARAVR